MDPDRHRSDQEQERHHEENQSELDLRTGPLTFQLLVLSGGTPIFFDVIQNSWLDEPANVEIDVAAELIETNERSYPVVAVICHDRHVAFIGKAHLVVGNRLEAESEREAGLRQHVAGAIEYHRLAEPAQCCLRRDHLLQMLWVEC